MGLLMLASAANTMLWAVQDGSHPTWHESLLLSDVLDHVKDLRGEFYEGDVFRSSAMEPAYLLLPVAINLLREGGPFYEQAVLPNVLLHAATLLLIYLLVLRLGKSRLLALAAATIYTTRFTVYFHLPLFFSCQATTAACCLAALALLGVRGFARPGRSAALGVSLGIGPLCGLYFVLLMAGPVLLAIFHAFWRPPLPAISRKRVAANICLCLSIALAMAGAGLLLWYDLDVLAEQLRERQEHQGFGWDLENKGLRYLSLLGAPLVESILGDGDVPLPSNPLFILLAAGGCLMLRGKGRVLLAWFGVGMMGIMYFTGVPQAKYLMPLMPVLAIAAALGLGLIKQRRLRVAAAAVVILLGVGESLYFNWHVYPPLPGPHDYRRVVDLVIDDLPGDSSGKQAHSSLVFHGWDQRSQQLMQFQLCLQGHCQMTLLERNPPWDMPRPKDGPCHTWRDVPLEMMKRWVSARLDRDLREHKYLLVAVPGDDVRRLIGEDRRVEVVGQLSIGIDEYYSRDNPEGRRTVAVLRRHGKQ